jgi:hypothetical protein
MSAKKVTIDPGSPRVKAAVIAQKYGVTERTIYLWAEKGKRGEKGGIPSIRINGTVRFDLALVTAAIEGTPATA